MIITLFGKSRPFASTFALAFNYVRFTVLLLAPPSAKEVVVVAA